MYDCPAPGCWTSSGASEIGVTIVYWRLSIAAVYVKTLNDEPGLRGGQTAKLYWLPGTLGPAEPTIASTWPVLGSIATSAPSVTSRSLFARTASDTERCAICCRPTSSVVMTV